MSSMTLKTIKRSGIFVTARMDGRSVDKDYIAEAKELAIAGNTCVVLDLNGVLLKITPDSDVNQVRDAYATSIDPGGEFF